VIENNEIKALLHLMDDPDEDVYQSVCEKIITFGKAIIPNLEHLWESNNNETTQLRVEQLIHRLHFRELTEEFTVWLNDSNSSLLSGSLIIAKYHFPEINATQVLQEIEKIRRNVWIELNAYLTPMEKITVLNSIFYNYYKQIGVDLNYESPDQFLINKTLETKSGNAISNGIVYLILCHLLDIPVSAIQIPKQFILAYFDDEYELSHPELPIAQKIVFYIDPVSGQMYSNKDVESYFKRMNVPPAPYYFKPMNNKQVIRFLLEELSKCYDNDSNRYKMDELLSLAYLIEI
jgi:regulator of sirC expression with transglutaminase-like and TPR domain